MSDPAFYPSFKIVYHTWRKQWMWWLIYPCRGFYTDGNGCLECLSEVILSSSLDCGKERVPWAMNEPCLPYTKQREVGSCRVCICSLCDSLKRLYTVEGWENSAPEKCYKTCTKI